MNNQLVIATVIAAILAIGMVAAPVFADSNQVKVQNKQNNHMKCGEDAICAGQGGDQNAKGCIFGNDNDFATC